MINKLTFLALLLVLVGGGCMSGLIDTIDDASTTVEEPTEASETSEPLDSTLDEVSYEGPLTVMDYYLELPAQYLGGLAVSDREDAIRTHDDGNYYLDFYPNTWDGNGSLAVFLHDDNRQIILVETKGCGPLCQQEVFAVEYVDGDWVDLTTEILPEVPAYDNKIAELEEAWLAEGNTDPENNFITNILYKIPQFGATIEVYDAISGSVLFELPWNGRTFDFYELEVGESFIDSE